MPTSGLSSWGKRRRTDVGDAMSAADRLPSHHAAATSRPDTAWALELRDMPEVCIVIPCFNEERRLRGPDILAFLREHPRIAVCFVDDGSSDGTLAAVETLRQFATDAVMALRLPVNQGKAEAVRQGILHAASAKRFSMLGYCDADLSTPLEELVGLLRVLDADPSCQLAMGARVRRLGSNIQRSAVRHYFGRVFATGASIILRLPVYDSQCGAKVLRAELVPVLFTEPFLTRWLFDVEILARLATTSVGRACSV